MINLQSLRSAHRKFLQAHDAAVSRSLNEARDDGIEHSQKHPGFTPRSGSQGLANATTGQIVRTSRGAFVRLENRKPHARPIDKGSIEHLIRAKSAKALRFTSSSGETIFRRVVKHPGNRPYHFLRSATTAAAHSFELRMTGRMRTIARQF